MTGVATWGILLIIVLVATAGKFGGTLAAARLTGLDLADLGGVGRSHEHARADGAHRSEHRPRSRRDLTDAVAMMVLMAVVTTMSTTPILALLRRPPMAAP